MDRRLGQELLKVISPLGQEAMLRALEELSAGEAAQRIALSGKLEQLEYEARKAFEQYDAVDAARVKGVPGVASTSEEVRRRGGLPQPVPRYASREAVLIVLDDVWHAIDVEPFKAESPRSRPVITTRDISIGAAFGAYQTGHFSSEVFLNL